MATDPNPGRPATAPADVELTLAEAYRFELRFGPADSAALLTDLGPPLGAHRGPDPERLLAAAVANCLAASLLFALRKLGQEPGGLRARATVQLARNAQGRQRVGGIAVALHLGVPAAGLPRLDRALAQFEAYCTVTESVRAAFPVDVQVFDGQGQRLR